MEGLLIPAYPSAAGLPFALPIMNKFDSVIGRGEGMGKCDARQRSRSGPSEGASPLCRLGFSRPAKPRLGVQRTRTAQPVRKDTALPVYGYHGSMIAAHASVGAATTCPTSGTILMAADVTRQGAAITPHPPSTMGNKPTRHIFSISLVFILSFFCQSGNKSETVCLAGRRWQTS